MPDGQLPNTIATVHESNGLCFELGPGGGRIVSIPVNRHDKRIRRLLAIHPITHPWRQFCSALLELEQGPSRLRQYSATTLRALTVRECIVHRRTGPIKDWRWVITNAGRAFAAEVRHQRGMS